MENYKKSLAAEVDYLRKELVTLNRRANAENNGRAAASERDETSELTTRIKLCRKRLSEINRRKILLEHHRLKDRDFKKALSLFEPVWDTLFPNEQARVIGLLVNKISYDGANNSAVITFRPLGVQALAEETAAKK